MPSNFTKQPQFLDQRFINTAGGDTTLQGVLTAVPTGVTGAIQGMQTIPGDRLVLGALDAFALSNSTIGTLYGGIYMYVASLSTGGLTGIGRLAFWDSSAFSIATTSPNAGDNLYRITSAELQAGAGVTGPIAGVYINTLTAGNFWWIQIAGKATMSFGTAANSQFGGTSAGYAKNLGVYAMGAGTTNGSGFVTIVNGTTFITTNALLDEVISQHVGIAEAVPAASTLSTVDMDPRLYRL